MVERVRPDERESWLSSVSAEGVRGCLEGNARGTERMLVKEVKRGRMYENVDDGAGGGGGVGGWGGGNHLCRDNRARSWVTCRFRFRSAFEPTM